MASIQVGVIVYGWMVTRRVNRMLAQVEQEMKPVAESLASIARDAARISSMATGQVERVDRSSPTSRLASSTPRRPCKTPC